MNNQEEIKKEWQKTKEHWLKFSREAVKIAKLGEKELVRLSLQGRLHLDATAINLKKDKLYYLIGKEYVKLKNPAESSEGLRKYVAELRRVHKHQRSLMSQMEKKNNKRAK